MPVDIDVVAPGDIQPKFVEGWYSLERMNLLELREEVRTMYAFIRELVAKTQELESRVVALEP